MGSELFLLSLGCITGGGLTGEIEMEAYVIVGSSVMAVFEEAVNSAIADGYVPQGGPTLETNYDDCGRENGRYMQAMYKPRSAADIENARRQRECAK